MIFARFLPHHTLSRLIALLANCRYAWVKRPLIRWFIRFFKIDTSEIKRESLDDYPNFNAFFIRELADGARPISPDPKTIVSAADGMVSQFGNIEESSLLQVKGRYYDLDCLLGENEQWTIPFRNGKFLTCYLSPRDYHRVHMPVAGKLRHMVYLPGRLYSVNAKAVATVPELFCRNERVVSFFDTKFGRVAVVMVGAMLVAGITTLWAGQVTPRRPHEKFIWHYATDEVSLDKGDEMGYFNYGSTVILLFQENTIEWLPELGMDMSIKMGQTIAVAN